MKMGTIGDWMLSGGNEDGGAALWEKGMGKGSFLFLDQGVDTVEILT
jgi:hypothetical protein